MAKRWLGLDWQLSLSSGWGLAGLNMAWVIEQDGYFKPVPLYPSAQLQSVRDELKDFVAKLYRHEEEVSGAEIGVQEGIYSEHILKTWKGSTLFSIDARQNFDAGESTSPTALMINKSSFMRIPHSGCDPLASTPLYGG